MVRNGTLANNCCRCFSKRNSVDAKTLEILVAVGVAGDLSFEPLCCKSVDVLADLSLITWGASHQVLEIQLYKAIRTVGFECVTPIGLRLGQGSDQPLNGEVTVHEQCIDGGTNIEFHQIAVAEHLAVSGLQHDGGLFGVLVCSAGEGQRGSHGWGEGKKKASSQTVVG